MVVTPPLTGTPSSVWYPIIPCLKLHLCLILHPLSGNPTPCQEPHPLSGTPSPCQELHPHVVNTTPCLEPYPLSVTPSPVWNPIPNKPPPHPSVPPHHLAPTPSPGPQCPPSGPCCPCLAPNCPTHLIRPQAAPIWNSYPLPPSPCPHPTLSNIITWWSSPPPEKEIWVFSSFPSFPMFISMSPCMGSISPHVIISFASRGKIPKIVVQQPRFHQ